MSPKRAHLPRPRSIVRGQLLDGRSAACDITRLGVRARNCNRIPSIQISSFSFRLPFLYILRTGLAHFAARSGSAHKQTSQPATELALRRQMVFAASRRPPTVRRGGDLVKIEVTSPPPKTTPVTPPSLPPTALSSPSTLTWLPYPRHRRRCQP